LANHGFRHLLTLPGRQSLGFKLEILDLMFFEASDDFLKVQLNCSPVDEIINLEELILLVLHDCIIVNCHKEGISLYLAFAMITICIVRLALIFGVRS